MLLVGLLAVAAAVIALLTFWRSDRGSDLGTVSPQWIAEQRLGPGSDSRH